MHTQWEYRLEIEIMMTETQLNKLGAEGWEHYNTSGNKHYFKRQKNSQPMPQVFKSEKEVKEVYGSTVFPAKSTASLNSGKSAPAKKDTKKK